MRSIEDIAVGDLVWARDSFDGQNVLRPVLNLFRRSAPDVYRVTLQSETGTSETTGVTGEHPLFVFGKGWTEVRALELNDEIVSSTTNARLKVTALQKQSVPSLVYNLEIAQDHSYFVGQLGAWSHNIDWKRVCFLLQCLFCLDRDTGDWKPKQPPAPISCPVPQPPKKEDKPK